MNDFSRVKLLAVGGHRTPSNAWRRVLAFRKIGVLVESLDTSNFGYFKRELFRKLAHRLGGSFISVLLCRELLKKIASFQPTIVFLEKSTWLRSTDIGKLRAAGPDSMQLVHYNPDDPFGDYRDGWADFIDAIPDYDAHFVPKAENEKEYRALGARRVYHFDRAYDPDLHHPVELSKSECLKYGCVVGFIGTYAPYREQVIADLIRHGIPVAVWGNGWRRGANWETIQPFWRGPGQYDEEYVKAICGMRIALHFLRRENRDEQDSRTFEIPACGTFMLAERSKTHERLFLDGKEAVFFEEFEDLKQKITHYTAEKEERERIAAAGLQRCRTSGYDHASRLRTILHQTLSVTP